MVKALLLTLLAVAAPVQAQFAYSCSVTEEPASSCCVAEDGAPSCGTGSSQSPQGQLPCAELVAQPCVEPAATATDHWVRSASPNEGDVDHTPPAAAFPSTDLLAAFTPPDSLCCAHPPVPSLGAGTDTYLVTQRLRI